MRLAHGQGMSAFGIPIKEKRIEVRGLAARAESTKKVVTRSDMPQIQLHMQFGFGALDDCIRGPLCKRRTWAHLLRYRNSIDSGRAAIRKHPSKIDRLSRKRSGTFMRGFLRRSQRHTAQIDGFSNWIFGIRIPRGLARMDFPLDCKRDGHRKYRCRDRRNSPLPVVKEPSVRCRCIW